MFLPEVHCASTASTIDKEELQTHQVTRWISLISSVHITVDCGPIWMYLLFTLSMCQFLFVCFYFASLTCRWFWLQVRVFSTSCLSYQSTPLYFLPESEFQTLTGHIFAFHSRCHRAETFSTSWSNNKRTQEEIERVFFSYVLYTYVIILGLFLCVQIWQYMILERVELLSLVFNLKFISYDYFVILKVRKTICFPSF